MPPQAIHRPMPRTITVRPRLQPAHSDSDRFDDRQERYRRDVLGLPSRLDIYLAAQLDQQLEDNLRMPEDDDQVRCMLWFTRQKVCDTIYESNHIENDALTKGALCESRVFVDPDVLTLYMEVHISPELIVVSRAQWVGPPAIIQWYVGTGDELDAPEWAQWPVGVVQEIWQDRGYIARLFMSLAVCKLNLDEVCTCGIYPCLC